MYSYAVVCKPAPRRPLGANTPGNASIHGMATSAVKRYPIAIARRASERRMENWANSRTAVIKSTTNMGAAYAGTKTSIRANWTVESGPAVMKKATSKASTIARASRRSARSGDKLERMKCCFSGTNAVFNIGETLRGGRIIRREAHMASLPFRARPVRRACNPVGNWLQKKVFASSFRLSPVRLDTPACPQYIALAHGDRCLVRVKCEILIPKCGRDGHY